MEEERMQEGAFEQEYKPKWVVARTVMGILSIILFLLIAFQSCAAGLGNALSENGEVGGSAGFLCAVNFLVVGLIVLVARKTVKKAPMIVAAVLMWLNLFYARLLAGSYSDLEIWGILSFIFGTVYLFSALRKKKQYIIAGVVAALYFAIIMLLGVAASSSAGASGQNGAAAPQETGTAGAVNTENSSDTQAADAGNAAGEAVNTEAGDNQAVNTQTNTAENTPTEPVTSEQRTVDWQVGSGKAITYTDSIGAAHVQISVPVTNTGNTNLYLGAGTMDLEDASGHLVSSESLVSVYPQILQPGETAWYYEETSLNEAPSSELTVVPHVDVREAKVNCIRYEVSDVSFTNDNYGGITATGRVKNTTNEDGSLIYVVAFLYDAQENFIGQVFTILTDELKPGDQIGFSTSTFGRSEGIDVSNIAAYRFFAYPEQFQF